MAIPRNYYFLTGTEGYFHDLLYRPYNWSLDRLNDSFDNYHRYKVIRLAEGLVAAASCLISLPFKVIGDLFECYHRREISNETFQQQKSAWEKRFVTNPPNEFSDIDQAMIKFLILSNVQVEDSKYQHIIMVKMHPHLSFNLFNPFDGRYPFFRPYISETEAPKSLIIGYAYSYADCAQLSKKYRKELNFISAKRPVLDPLSLGFKLTPTKVDFSDQAEWLWLGQSRLPYLPLAEREKIIRLFNRSVT